MSTDTSVFRGTTRGVTAKSIHGQTGGTVTLTPDEAKAEVIELSGTISGAVSIKFPSVPGKQWHVRSALVHSDGEYQVTLSGTPSGTVTLSTGRARTIYCTESGALTALPVDLSAEGALSATGAAAAIPNAATYDLPASVVAKGHISMTGVAQACAVTFLGALAGQGWDISNHGANAVTCLGPDDEGSGIAIAASRSARIAFDAGTGAMTRISADAVLT